METAIAHVTNRGNNRAAIFLDEIDYLTVMRMLEEVRASRGWVSRRPISRPACSS